MALKWRHKANEMVTNHTRWIETLMRESKNTVIIYQQGQGVLFNMQNDGF